MSSWRERASALRIKTSAFIGGRFTDAQSGRYFPVINPATGRHLADVAACGPADVDTAVRAARRAFDDGRWSGLRPRDRKRILLRFAELIRDARDELALTETLTMGKPISDALSIDVRATADCIAYYAETADKIYGEIAPTHESYLALVMKEPAGVVGCVTPWNFPMIMAAWKFAPALAAGNSVILKPAEQSPLTAIRLAELAAEAGVPEGAFNVLPGLGEEAGRALGLHPDVDVIAFTGSTEVGKYFLRYAAESNQKRVSLECGGKTPFVVAADCPDLDRAAEAAAGAIFFNQGEMCTAGSRLLLDRAIACDFLPRLEAHARAWMPGDPLDPSSRAGAVVSEEHMARVLSAIERGRSEGAEVIAGGRRVHEETGGYFIAPTIFSGVHPASQLAQNEIFGPVLSVLTFDGLDDALRIANSTIYGLGAAIWSADTSRALQFARRLQAGIVYVNCFDADDLTTPFGGVKQSGQGRDKSLHALEKYINLKSVWVQLGEPMRAAPPGDA